MPMVRISYVRENLGADAAARKAAIADKISQAMADEMGVARKDVWVVFEDVGAADWHLGPDSVAELRKNKT